MFLFQDGITPLHVATGNGHAEVVDLLVHAGADINLAATEVHNISHTVSLRYYRSRCED